MCLMHCVCALPSANEINACAWRSKIVAPGHRHGDSFFLSRRLRVFRRRERVSRQIHVNLRRMSY